MSDKPTHSEIEYSEKWCRSKIAELEAEKRAAEAEAGRQICLNTELEAEKKEIGLSIALDSKNALTIGDIGLIQRVLENLVRNAIRFTPKGGEITLSITERPDSVTSKTRFARPRPAPGSASISRMSPRFSRRLSAA